MEADKIAPDGSVRTADRRRMPEFIVNNPTLLAATIAFAAMDGGLIVFDGRPRAGKSFLAREMAKHLGGTAIDADDFLQRDREDFLNALDVDALRGALEAARPPLLLSSLCARQVIERLGLSAAIFIWVEKTSRLPLQQTIRDFALDTSAGPAGAVTAYREEAEAYVAAHDARMRPDGVVYLNAQV